MANKNKTKGKNFERQVCDIFAKVYNVNFQRVPNSGAYTGGLNVKRYEGLTPEQKLLADGDIIVPSFLSHLSIECKSYKDFPFHSLYTQQSRQLDEWIKQASSTKKSKWLLFFKINNKGIYVVYDYNQFPNVLRNNHTVYNNYIIELAEDFVNKNKEELLKNG
jgi:Holliday junction resolvase